jgi:hypothetical protein
MASRATYVLLCDDCGENYTPVVAFPSDERLAHEACVARTLTDVRLEAERQGWKHVWHTPEGRGLGWSTDRCPECVRVTAGEAVH